MRKVIAKKIIILGFILLVALPVASLAENYKVDASHSAVIFKVSHLGYSFTYGRFNKINGTYDFDAKNENNFNIELIVETDSVDTGNERRDKHLRAKEFFNVKAYPQIRFKSTTIKKRDDKVYDVRGELSFRGKVRQIETVANFIGAGKDSRGRTRSGFETSFTIKRSDFGMDFMIGGIGDEVTIMVSIEGVKNP